MTYEEWEDVNKRISAECDRINKDVAELDVEFEAFARHVSEQIAKFDRESKERRAKMARDAIELRKMAEDPVGYANAHQEIRHMEEANRMFEAANLLFEESNRRFEEASRQAHENAMAMHMQAMGLW